MSKRRRGGHDHDEGGHGNDERWLLTYADMITLLLALFILLFSVSTIDQKKFEALAIGLRQEFNPKPGVLQSSNGVLAQSSLTKTAGQNYSQEPEITQPPASTTTTVAPSSAAPNPESSASLTQLDQIEQRVNSALSSKGLANTVRTSVQDGELTIEILADKVFFATDSADLGALGDEVVDTIASVIGSYPNLVDVDGYTDDQAITGGPFSSNEELSAVRAVNVVQRLSTTDGISASRLAATGFGDTHPAAPNNSPANMALNRRIDVVVLGVGRTQP